MSFFQDIIDTFVPGRAQRKNRQFAASQSAEDREFQQRELDRQYGIYQEAREDFLNPTLLGRDPSSVYLGTPGTRDYANRVRYYNQIHSDDRAAGIYDKLDQFAFGRRLAGQKSLTDHGYRSMIRHGRSIGFTPQELW